MILAQWEVTYSPKSKIWLWWRRAAVVVEEVVFVVMCLRDSLSSFVVVVFDYWGFLGLGFGFYEVDRDGSSGGGGSSVCGGVFMGLRDAQDYYYS